MKNKKLFVLLLILGILVSGCSKAEMDSQSGQTDSEVSNITGVEKSSKDDGLVYLYVNRTINVDGEETSYTEYKYNENGIMLSSLSKSNGNESTADYNAEGYSIESFSFDKNEEVIGKYIYERDSSNRVKKYSYYRYGEDMPDEGLLWLEYTYEYNLDGSCKKQIENSLSSYSNMGKNNEYSENTYDYKYNKKNGKIVSVEVNQNGYAYCLIEFEYLDGTDLLKSRYVYNLQNASLVTEETYTYDDFSNLICIKTVNYGDFYEGGKTETISEYEYKLFPKAKSDSLNGSTKVMMENILFNR